MRDVPLGSVQPGAFLLLGDDPLLDPRRALHLFCEPTEVVAVHRRHHPDERLFLRDGGMILRAVGWADRRDDWICLEMARRGGGRVLVCFPDDRHTVSPVRVWTPEGHAEMLAEHERGCGPWMIVDPATGHRHDCRDLSGYRLPSFWRDASVVWHALPASWIGKRGWLSELLVFEAISGVRHPASAAILASETAFRHGVTIAVATLSWRDATLLDHGEDGTLDPLLGPVFHSLVDDCGTPEALRSAAIGFVDGHLAASGADPAYLERFIVERAAICDEVAGRPRLGT